MPGLHDVARRRDAQRLLFDAFAAAAQYAAFPGIDQPGQAAFELPVNHVAQYFDPKSNYGSSATTSICTRNPGSTRRCTCTHEVVGSRSLS